MPILRIERLGGLANFGGARSRIRSRGELDTGSLLAAEREALEALFQNSPEEVALNRATVPADGFRYRITRNAPAGPETIEVPESRVPPAVACCVKDELV